VTRTATEIHGKLHAGSQTSGRYCTSRMPGL
jgi:hypothetical protein